MGQMRFLSPQSLGTIAGAGSQAICWCSSVMDGCITALLQPKQLFNQPKRLHRQNHLSFYLEPSVQPLVLLSHTSSCVYWRISPCYNDSVVLSRSPGPLSVIKDASLQRLMFSYALLEHLQDEETNTFFSRPFATTPINLLLCNNLFPRLPCALYCSR